MYILFAGATARSESFGYDALRRLTDADGLYGDIDYAYDAVGNRTSRAIFDGLITITDTYTIASTSNRLVSTTDGSTTRSFSYDAMGSVSQDDRGVGTPYDLTHNDEGRLVEIAQGLTTLATYKHNAFGQRVVKTAGSSTTHYHYDLSGRLIAESNGSGTVQREFIHLGSLPLAVVDHTVGGGPALYHVHADQLGTPRRMTDGTKAIVWNAVFRPFGEVESLTGTATNDNRFQGQRLDDVAGFHYNYFRDYDPSLGRYMQSDPIGLEGGINTYAYAHSDPANLTDPRGLYGVPALGDTNQQSRVGDGSSCHGGKPSHDQNGLQLANASRCVRNPWAIGCQRGGDFAGPVVGGPRGRARDPNAADKQRVQENREKRRIRRENESRDEVGQNRSGEGYRDHESANKGPRGVRPARDNSPRPRKDTTSPHADGFNNPRGAN